MKPAKLRFFLLITALCLGLAFVGTGCHDGDDDYHHNHDDGYYGDGTGTLRLINGSTVTIDYFYLTPADRSDWGLNLLPGPLPSLASADIVGISVGIYDARAKVIGQYSEYSAYSYDIPIREGRIYDLYAYDSSFTGSLRIVNHSIGATIVAVYVVPASATSWGPNQLSAPVGPSGALHLYDMADGDYDIRVVWDAGPDSLYYDIPVDSLTLTTKNAT
jgi:hypothetical protein